MKHSNLVTCNEAGMPTFWLLNIFVSRASAVWCKVHYDFRIGDHRSVHCIADNSWVTSALGNCKDMLDQALSC